MASCSCSKSPRIYCISCKNFITGDKSFKHSGQRDSYWYKVIRKGDVKITLSAFSTESTHLQEHKYITISSPSYLSVVCFRNALHVCIGLLDGWCSSCLALFISNLRFFICSLAILNVPPDLRMALGGSFFALPTTQR